MQQKGSNLLETRRQNRVLIKKLIFNTKYITRTEVAEKLDLTLPTITTSVNEMITEGIIEEIPLPENKTANMLGRKPTAIQFRAEAANAIGIEFGPYKTYAVLINMHGEILKSFESETAPENYELMIQKITTLLRKNFFSESNNPPKKILGIGIGIPGFVDCEKGIVRINNLRRDWLGKSMADDLAKKLGLHVLMENNARARALGHEMSLQGERPDSFAYFFISYGVACPLILKDSIVSGQSYGAGEVGQSVLLVNKIDGHEYKTVDSLGSENAIFRLCLEKMQHGKAKILETFIQKNGQLTMKEVLAAQKCGDNDVIEIMDNALEYLGTALANVVNLINPGLVVVDGYMLGEEQNRQKLKIAAKNKFFGLNEEEVRLIFVPHDHYSGAKGAALLILDKLFLKV